MEEIKQKLDPEFKAKWVAALRSGEYKQGTRSLCRKNSDGDYEYCCLGLAYKIIKGKNPIDTVSGYIWGSRIDADGIPAILTGTGGSVTGEGADIRFHLANMNDRGKSFSEIADYIEQNL